MKKIAVIVCNNGLGHIKRVLFLLNLYYKKFLSKIQAEIFVNKDKIAYFPSIINDFNRNKYGINFLHLSADVFDYEKEFMKKYKNHLIRADYIWSDNLIFPLKYRREVFLTGSFLWQDVINNTNIIKKEEKILFENQPTMIANKYFATPKVKLLQNYVGVGMYEYFPFQIPDNFYYKILLSCGKSRQANVFFKKNLPIIKKEIQKIPSYIDIFIEPDYFKFTSSAKNIIKANFTEEMFSCISAAAIRPGIGTVCDVLLKGGRIFSFCEDNNIEINHNAEVLEKLKVGEKCRDVKQALSKSVNYLFNKELQETHYVNLKKIDFHGLDQTITNIDKILN